MNDFQKLTQLIININKHTIANSEQQLKMKIDFIRTPLQSEYKKQQHIFTLFYELQQMNKFN